LFAFFVLFLSSYHRSISSSFKLRVRIWSTRFNSCQGWVFFSRFFAFWCIGWNFSSRSRFRACESLTRFEFCLQRLNFHTRRVEGWVSKHWCYKSFFFFDRRYIFYASSKNGLLLKLKTIYW
jgi:hypothetical protein